MLHEINSQFSVICFTETWCQGSENEKNYNFHLTEYTSVHQPRAGENHAGGGVCVFIHNS